MNRAIIFGAGGTGKRILSEVRRLYDVVAFVDSDSRKWGDKIHDIDICSPDRLNTIDYDYIVIGSLPGYETILQEINSRQLNGIGVISSYVELPILSRIEFIKKLSLIFKENEIGGQVAEAGVFEGDFAKELNYYFSDRDLYLFDTFEGFSNLDICEEVGLSTAKVGDYAHTTEKMVMDKMPYPDKVKIFKGYFPDSAKQIDESFCFVNLDLDLYLPTINGLEYFMNKMVSGGVILIHDYFSDTFQGPKKAVDEFVSKYDGYRILPIGDGISIAVLGF